MWSRSLWRASCRWMSLSFDRFQIKRRGSSSTIGKGRRRQRSRSSAHPTRGLWFGRCRRSAAAAYCWRHDHCAGQQRGLDIFWRSACIRARVKRYSQGVDLGCVCSSLLIGCEVERLSVEVCEEERPSDADRQEPGMYYA